MPAILKAISDLNISPFQQKMGKLQSQVNKFTTQDLSKLGSQIGSVFSVYAVARFASELGKAADTIDNVAKATGAGYENLQALQVLFIENGRAGSELGAILGRLRKSMDEATVDPKMAQSFAQLGISFKDIANLSPDRVLELIARSLQRTKGDMVAGEAAGNLLGRSYAELQGVMSDLATKGLDPLRESLKKTNQIMTDDTVRALDKLQEAFDKIKRQSFTFFGGKALGLVQHVQTLGAVLGAYDPNTGDVDWNAVSSTMYGTPESYDPQDAFAENNRKKASAEKMQATLTAARDKAVAAAQKWYEQSVGKITVSKVTAADALGRIGGYIGGQASPMASIAERQLKIMEIEKQLTEKIAAASDLMKVSLQNIEDSVTE